MIPAYEKLTRLMDYDGPREALDELVHDVASSEATSVNNEGLDAQLKYLQSRGYDIEAVLEAVDDGTEV